MYRREQRLSGSEWMWQWCKPGHCTSRYLFRVPACFTNPNMSVAHSLVTQHALNSLSPLFATPQAWQRAFMRGHVSEQRLQNLVCAPSEIYVLLISTNEEKECAWLRKGQADGLGGQGSQTCPTMPRTTAWTMHHVKVHQFSQTFPWKYDTVDGEKKNCAASFYVLSNGASEATQGPLPEIRVLFRGTFVFRATFLRDLAMSTPNPGSCSSWPKWRHKSQKHRVEPSWLHRAWLAA